MVVSKSGVNLTYTRKFNYYLTEKTACLLQKDKCFNVMLVNRGFTV